MWSLKKTCTVVHNLYDSSKKHRIVFGSEPSASHACAWMRVGGLPLAPASRLLTVKTGRGQEAHTCRRCICTLIHTLPSHFARRAGKTDVMLQAAAEVWRSRWALKRR